MTAFTITPQGCDYYDCEAEDPSEAYRRERDAREAFEKLMEQHRPEYIRPDTVQRDSIRWAAAFTDQYEDVEAPVETDGRRWWMKL